MKKLKLKAPAKINLYLKVLDKRPDGYHNIQSIFQAISLYDELEFELKATAGVRVSCQGADIPAADNLVQRAALLLQKRFAPAAGISIGLKKHIPIAAGLGGGSSDAAATLCALNSLWGLNLSQEQLMQLAAGLGADVPFFIHAKAALVEGIGDRLTPWPSLSCWLVLAKPHFKISTAWAYQKLGLEAGTSKERLTIPKNCIRIRQPIWGKNKLASIAGYMYNDFEALIAREHPLVPAIKEELLASKATGALMSGSGPTVFGLFRQETTARKAYSRLKQFIKERGEVFLAKTIDGQRN